MNEAPSVQTTPWLERQFRAMGQWRKPQFWGLSVLLIYTLSGFFVLPRVLESTLQSRMSETGRSASVDDVRFNPFTLTLDIDGLEIIDTDQVPMMSFETLHINVQTSSIFRWAATFREITLVGLSIAEERFKGLDTRWTRLITDFSTEPAETESANNADGLPRLIIFKLSVQNAGLGITDRQAGGFTTRLGPISVDIGDLRTLPDHSGVQAVEINTDEGGVVRWQGTIETVPARSEGRLFVEGHGLSDAMRYAQHFLPFVLTGDGTTVSLDYVFELDQQGPRLRVDQLQAETRGLAITPQNTDSPVLQTDSIVLKDGTLAWPEQQLTLAELAVNGLKLDVALLEDGEINLLELLPPVTEEAPSAEAPRPWDLQLNAFNLNQGAISVSDQTMAPPVSLTLNEIQVGVQGINLLDETSMPSQASMVLSSGGKVQFDGQLTAFPSPAVTGAVAVDTLQLSVVQPYLEQIVRTTLNSGSLTMQADIHHEPAQLLSAAGSLELSGFELSDQLLNERLAGWESLKLNRFEVDLDAAKVNTSVVELMKPYGRLHIAEDLSTNLSGLMVETDTASGPGPGQAPSELDITIGGVSLQNASLDFSDFSLPLPFEAAIRSMDGEISTLATSSEEPAELDLEGQVNEFGLARIGGVINAWDPTALTDIQMTFRNLELSRLTPYTVQFAGYAIEEGRMDLDLDYALDKRQLRGDNSVIIRDILLGEKLESEGAGSLPLGLAVALLTDSEGVIDVALPVEGNLDDPEFRIGGVVIRALANLITKVVTAPFRFLAGLVGADSEDFGQVQFQPGEAEISPPDREKLIKLREAMVQRPELTLEISGVYAQTLDQEALSRLALETSLKAWLNENPGRGEELSTEQDRRSLEALFMQQFPEQSLALIEAEFTTAKSEGQEAVFDQTAYLASLRERLTSVQNISPEDLEALAQQRAEAVAAVLASTSGEPGDNDPGPLRLSRAAVTSIEAEDASNIILELKVTAEDVAASEP